MIPTGPRLVAAVGDIVCHLRQRTYITRQRITSYFTRDFPAPLVSGRAGPSLQAVARKHTARRAFAQTLAEVRPSSGAGRPILRAAPTESSSYAYFIQWQSGNPRKNDLDRKFFSGHLGTNHTPAAGNTKMCRYHDRRFRQPCGAAAIANDGQVLRVKSIASYTRPKNRFGASLAIPSDVYAPAQCDRSDRAKLASTRRGSG